MKVQNKNINKNIQPQRGEVNRVGKAPQVHRDFNELFQEHSDAWQERLELLLAQMDELGKRLLKSFSVYDLISYKNALKNFLADIHKKVYGIKEENGWTRGGRHKLYQRLELLDKELEELTKAVLDKQKDPVNLLNKLDTIRGLLVDLYS
jgi:uncharacterized protein YaaR (DUF327 family)